MQFPFQQWISHIPLIGGDWRYFYPINRSESLNYTYAWDSCLNSGLGKSNIEILWLNTYFGFGTHVLTNILHIPWQFAEKILFFWPIILLSIIGPYILSSFITKNRFVRLVASLVYLCNTYIVMIASGGQVGILLSYAVAPLTLYWFIRLLRSIYVDIKKKTAFSFSLPIIFGLVSGVQILFEPRMFMITAISFLIYVFAHVAVVPVGRGNMYRFLHILIKNLIVSGIVVLLLHAFWILPALVGLKTGSAFTELGVVDSANYFSFTRFENAFSFLHPNWPENIFGKTYFMRFEFLLIPIVGFIPLLFAKRTPYKRHLLFGGILVIVGAFLAKGTNEPFGFIYQYLTTHIPGFTAFRDASKFLLLVSIGYSIMFPIGIVMMYEKVKISLRYIVIAFVIFWLGLHHAAFTGEIGGTFAKQELPQEYNKLYSFIENDREFYRTLWVPTISSFTPLSQNHPAVSMYSFIKDYNVDSLSSFLNDQGRAEFLQEWGIAYIVIPTDPLGELFLYDRTYSQELVDQTKQTLDSIAYLTPVETNTGLTDYKVQNSHPHVAFLSQKQPETISYTVVSPSEYIVTVGNSQPDQTILLSELFDPNWKLIDSNGVSTSSVKTASGMNSFSLTDRESGTYRIYYTLQEWSNYGFIISIVTLIVIIGFLIVSYYAKKNVAKT